MSDGKLEASGLMGSGAGAVKERRCNDRRDQ
jgi:hypothetical protein